MDYSLPGSSVHGIFQARVLEWVAISFSRDLPNPGFELRSHALQADTSPSELPGKPVLSLTKAEVERFYEDLQDLLELTAKKDVLFIMGDWNAKVGCQETPGVTGKFGLRTRNEAGQG